MAAPGAIGVGAGTPLIAAGLIAVFFALVGSSRLNFEEESVPTDATSIAPLTPAENQRPVWPP